MLRLIVVLLFYVSTAAAAPVLPPEKLNNRPLIGILIQEVVNPDLKPYGEHYIPASYVKHVESGGARAMPIRLNLTREEHEKIFNSINGLLVIGGKADVDTSEFANVTKLYFQLALKANDMGDYFPIWGTCMGLQLFTILVAGEDLLTNTTAKNVSLPLNLTSEASSSRMFASFPPDLFKALSEEPMTWNFHYSGVTEQVFRENEKLNSFFSILSTNRATNGAVFVSTMEGRKYPFYGVQWHPEANRFRWHLHYSYPHSTNSVRMASLLAEFFVNEGRRSLHHFSDPEEERRSLIYNYNPLYAENFSAYQQVYFF